MLRGLMDLRIHGLGYGLGLGHERLRFKVNLGLTPWFSHEHDRDRPFRTALRVVFEVLQRS